MNQGNPYVPKWGPLFYGREQLVGELLQNEQAGKSLVLLGGRRCGNTALLRSMEQLLRGMSRSDQPDDAIWLRVVGDAIGQPPRRNLPVHWPVLVNFVGVRFSVYESVFSHLAESIAGSFDLGEPYQQVPPGIAMDPTRFERWLKEVDLYLAGKDLGGIALLIDGIEAVFNYPWSHHLLSFFRRLDDYTLRAGSGLSSRVPTASTNTRVHLTAPPR
jgi:hypothetical protein